MFIYKNMFAVVETGGKQYMVKPGDIIMTEKVVGDTGSVINFDQVIAIDNSAGGDLSSSAKVTAKVLEHKRTRKVIIFKKKRRHNYRRKRGHRQQITVLRIEEIIS